MLGVQLSPDTSAEGVYSQALGQAGQELHRTKERKMLGPQDGEKEGAGASGNKTSATKGEEYCQDP